MWARENILLVTENDSVQMPAEAHLLFFWRVKLQSLLMISHIQAKKYLKSGCNCSCANKLWWRGQPQQARPQGRCVASAVDHKEWGKAREDTQGGPAISWDQIYGLFTPPLDLLIRGLMTLSAEFLGKVWRLLYREKKCNASRHWK